MILRLTYLDITINFERIQRVIFLFNFSNTKITSSLYLPKIFDTHPFETWSIRDISQGLAPEWASSIIFCLVESGKGRPFT